MDINLFIKGYSYDSIDDNNDDDNGFVLDILIGDKNYKDKEKDIAFITYTNEILYPDNIVILINYNKYSNYIEQNKKQILWQLQEYAHSIDRRIPVNK